MNAKAIVPLVAGLGIAGVAAKLGFDYVKKAQGAPTKTVQLWTTTEDVPRGTAISEQMLAPMAFPSNLAPKAAVADKTKLVGRVPHTGVSSGVPILESMLLAPGTKSGIHVPPGYRAVAVKIDESSGVDNHLQPGAHVDVVGYFTIKSKSKAETRARTLIEDVEVAAVGQNISAEVPTKPDPKDKSSRGRSEKPARAATLLVKPDQVPVLLLAEQRGKIKLSMRGTETLAGGDDSVTHRQVDEHEVLGTEAPEDPIAKSDTGKGDGLGGLIAGLFGGKDKPQADKPVVEPKIEEPAPPPVPRYVAMMTIYQGPEKRILGWTEGKMTEAVDITGDSETNIFQEGGTKKKPGKSAGKAPPMAGEPTSPATQDEPAKDEPANTDAESPSNKGEPKLETKPSTPATQDKDPSPEPAIDQPPPTKNEEVDTPEGEGDSPSGESEPPSDDNERPVGPRTEKVSGESKPEPAPETKPEEQME